MFSFLLHFQYLDFNSAFIFSSITFSIQNQLLHHVLVKNTCVYIVSGSDFVFLAYRNLIPSFILNLCTLFCVCLVAEYVLGILIFRII